MAELQSVHHDSIFTPETKDPEIFRFVSNNNLILVTYDRAIVRAEKVALKEFSPSVVFLTTAIGKKKIADQITWYQTVWVQVCKTIKELPPQTQVRVTVGGDIRILE